MLTLFLCLFGRKLEVWNEKKIGRLVTCFFCAFMGENWMTKMAENWEIGDRRQELRFLFFVT